LVLVAGGEAMAEPDVTVGCGSHDESEHGGGVFRRVSAPLDLRMQPDGCREGEEDDGQEVVYFPQRRFSEFQVEISSRCVRGSKLRPRGQLIILNSHGDGRHHWSGRTDELGQAVSGPVAVVGHPYIA
jgi:hypothetical protein